MGSKGKSEQFSEEDLRRIVDRYSQDRIVVSNAYGDRGIDPLWPRFERAANNQRTHGEATLSRYAIWANTVRDNIIEGLSLIEAGKVEDAKRLLLRAANSMSAFSDVQAYFDPFEMGKTR